MVNKARQNCLTPPLSVKQQLKINNRSYCRAQETIFNILG